MSITMKRFGEDLTAVRAKKLSFNTLLKRYSGLVYKIVRPWYAMPMTPGHYDIDDLIQEAWMEIARGVDEYKPELGVPFERYIRLRIHNRMHPIRHRAQKRLARDWQYLSLQLVEDRVIEFVGKRDFEDDSARTFVAVSEPNQLEFDLYEDAMQCMSRVVGELPSVHATAVVQTCQGHARERIVAKHFAHCARPTKEYLRAIAGATKRVERLRADRAQQEMNFDHGEPANDNECTKQEKRHLRGVKKVSGTDAGADFEKASVA